MTLFSALRFRPIIAIAFAACLAGFAHAQAPAKLDAPGKATVAGKFIGNGKNGVIKFVLAEEGEPFGGAESLKLIFTEKDPAKVKKPSFDAMFGELGNALVLSVDLDGKIFGCEVSHSAHEKKGFSSVGRIKMTEFKIEGGSVAGHVSTGGELDTFGEKWEVDLTFTAPLPAKGKKAAKPATKPVEDEPNEPAKPEPKHAGPAISARKLALPKDAAEVEYKEIVNQIQFSSARPVAAVTKEFSANLKQQGWKESAGSLVGKNSILKREQGDAKLTIMIQATGTGSTVKIFTEGLDWSGAGEANLATPKAAKDDDDDAEAEAKKAINEAQKALKDALKGLPKGL